MEFSIGTQIKNFRKKRGFTQEQLAKMIGISFQAISKWENNISFPDITLIPELAKILNVTTDELFAYNQKEIQEDIERYIDTVSKLRKSNPEQGRKILNEALEKYPENEILLNNLLYVTNYDKNPDETIKIASQLIDRTTDNEIKYDAMRFLAYAYNVKGDTSGAKAALEKIPELYFTKLSEMAFILSGNAKYEAAEKQKWISFEIMLQMMAEIMEYYKDNGNTRAAISEGKCALSLISSLSNESKINNFQSYIDYFKKQLAIL